MIVLTIRTDKPEAELGLFNDERQLAYEVWQAHRELAETIHLKLQMILQSQHIQLASLQAIIVFQGPGSFTGLRIGISVANALADGLLIPIVGIQTDNWISDGITRLQRQENDHVVLPEYGAPPHITPPKR